MDFFELQIFFRKISDILRGAKSAGMLNVLPIPKKVRNDELFGTGDY